MKKLTKTLLAASLLAVAGTAAAVPISGTIGFAGAYTTDTEAGGDLNLDTATQIFINGDSAFVLSGLGDFAGLVGSTAVYNDFQFAPSFALINEDGTTAGVPETVLWSVGGFSMSVDSLTIDTQNVNGIVLVGTGTLDSIDPLLDATTGEWSFTANQGFTWSSGAAPEPGVILLLGAGLIGIGAARKMRKAA